jgi:uncharacterized protein (TIGR03492 family)
MKRNLLVISNGKGEDAIAVTILNLFRKVLKEEFVNPENISILTLPLVDNGSTYKNYGYSTAATWNTLPSKGFSNNNPLALLQDIKFGLFHDLKKQIYFVKKESASADLIVTVGDIMPLFLAAFFGNGKPIIHVGTALSAYIRNYSLPEIWLLKKFTVCTICRDALTAEKLKELKVPAIYYGNPMMDDPVLIKKNIDLGLEKSKKNIVLIPSSREDAYQNTVRMLNIISLMEKRIQFQFILSLSPNLNDKLLMDTVRKAGWKYKDLSDTGKPLIAEISSPSANTVYVIKGYFRDCLEGALAVFGMTGTGNEQIAGLGIPIILFQGKSSAASANRMTHYKKLLGDSVFIANQNDKKIAQAILGILRNGKQLAHMAEVGRERMGKTGGAYSIAKKIFSELMI